MSALQAGRCDQLSPGPRARRSWPPVAHTGCGTPPNGCPSPVMWCAASFPARPSRTRWAPSPCCATPTGWSASTTSARTSPTPMPRKRPSRPTCACSTHSGTGSGSGVVEPLEVSLKLSALGPGAAEGRRQDRPRERPRHLRTRAAGGRLGDRGRRGPHHHRLDAVDRAGVAHRVRLAGNGSAGLPQAHRGRLRRIRRLRRPDPAVQGRLRRAGLGGLPRPRRGHRVLPALPGDPDGAATAIRWSPHTIRRSSPPCRAWPANSARGTDAFEYQMLYGIRDGEQRRLAAEGNHVRVYVPFGSQWYGYFVRRLAERPANLMFFLRALAHRH